MCTILELWDIHEHNASTYNQLMIDKKFIFKRFLFFEHQQLNLRIVLCTFWTLLLLIQ